MTTGQDDDTEGEDSLPPSSPVEAGGRYRMRACLTLFVEFAWAGVWDGRLAKNKRAYSRIPLTLNLDALCENGRGCGFESRHPGHPSSMLYKLALSESGCGSEKFLGSPFSSD